MPSQRTQDLLEAYRSAPRHMQNYLQLVAFINAGKTPCPLMCQQLELLAALIVANADRGADAATRPYIPKPIPLANERRGRRQAAVGSLQARPETPQSHPGAGHPGATAPQSEDAP